MDFTQLIANLKAGDTEKALEIAEALAPEYEKTVSDLSSYESKFTDAVGTRDKAKAKVRAIVEALGLSEDEATPEKVKEVLKASRNDDAHKADIENLQKLIEQKDEEYAKALAEKDAQFSDKMLEIEIAKLGLTADVVNDKALTMVIDSLKAGAVLENGEIVYKDGDAIARNSAGRPITVAEKMEQFKADASNAFLFKATAEGGGGSKGSGATASKKFNEYTSGELVELHRTNPQEYQRLRNEYYNKA